MSRFQVHLDPDNEWISWKHPEALEVYEPALADIAEEHRSAARKWFMVKGMQVHLEQRTSQDMANGAQATLDARRQLWENICISGHEYKEPREGGISSVSCEIEALAKLKGVPVSSIQKKRKEYSKEKWAKILAHPDVVVEAEAIRLVRAESEEVELDEFES